LGRVLWWNKKSTVKWVVIGKEGERDNQARCVVGGKEGKGESASEGKIPECVPVAGPRGEGQEE